MTIVDDATIGPDTVLPPFFSMFISPPREGTVRLRGAILQITDRDEDYYVYSVTAYPDPCLFRAFACDTCVRISKPRSFFSTLSEAICDRLLTSDDPVASMKAVTYGPRHGRYNQAFDAPGVFVKPSHYAYQREVRMLWTPAAIPIEPFIATVPSLTKYCDIVATLDSSRSPDA